MRGEVVVRHVRRARRDTMLLDRDILALIVRTQKPGLDVLDALDGLALAFFESVRCDQKGIIHHKE
jgi:hypothetical protein